MKRKTKRSLNVDDLAKREPKVLPRIRSRNKAVTSVADGQLSDEQLGEVSGGVMRSGGTASCSLCGTTNSLTCAS